MKHTKECYILLALPFVIIGIIAVFMIEMPVLIGNFIDLSNPILNDTSISFNVVEKDFRGSNPIIYAGSRAYYLSSKSEFDNLSFGMRYQCALNKTWFTTTNITNCQQITYQKSGFEQLCDQIKKYLNFIIQKISYAI